MQACIVEVGAKFPMTVGLPGGMRKDLVSHKFLTLLSFFITTDLLQGCKKQRMNTYDAGAASSNGFQVGRAFRSSLTFRSSSVLVARLTWLAQLASPRRPGGPELERFMVRTLFTQKLLQSNQLQDIASDIERKLQYKDHTPKLAVARSVQDGL